MSKLHQQQMTKVLNKLWFYFRLKNGPTGGGGEGGESYGMWILFNKNGPFPDVNKMVKISAKAVIRKKQEALFIFVKAQMGAE